VGCKEGRLGTGKKNIAILNWADRDLYLRNLEMEPAQGVREIVQVQEGVHGGGVRGDG
jgi:hypothetical protein